MEKENNFSESIICTGSDMNHRTFREDESWNSLQSTILAGQFSMNSDSEIPDKKNNLTTLDEENSVLSKEDSEFESIEEDENMLNMNLDAISDDVFFDCQNISKTSNELNSPFKSETPSKIFQVPSIKQLLSVNSPSSVNNESTTDSGLEEEKTGALLVQIVEDFKDMKDHAQSTPKLTSENKHLSPITSASKNLKKLMKSMKNNNDATNIATSLKIMTNVNSETKNCTGKRTLNYLTTKTGKPIKSPCYRQYSPVDRKNKENFFAGKYSNAVNVVSKANPNLPSPLEKRPHRVAQIKEFFENQSKIYDQTRYKKIESKAPARKIGLKSILHSTKSPQMRSARSPSYHTQETFKLLKSSKAFKANNRNVAFNNSGTTSFLLRNQTHNTNRSRPSSCSEFIPESSANCHLSKNASILMLNKSKSLGDLSRDSVKYIQLLHAREMKMVTKRPYISVNPCMTLIPKSPKSQKVSDIMKRKSLGYVSSPVKPVKELRKIFSPSGEMNANQVKKRSNKKAGGLQIIISKE